MIYMDDTEKLVLLRIELYSAAQTLKGKEAKEFWALLDEVQSIRDKSDSSIHPCGGAIYKDLERID